MRSVRQVNQADVWDHWTRLECQSDLADLSGEAYRAVMHKKRFEHRSDIKGGLPPDIVWQIAIVEDADIERMYIISSGDWADLSRGTFRVDDVVRNINANHSDCDSRRHSKYIIQLRDLYAAGTTIDTRFILVAPHEAGPFTIMDGNHRLTALGLLDQLVGIEVYLGISSRIRGSKWTVCSQ